MYPASFVNTLIFDPDCNAVSALPKLVTTSDAKAFLATVPLVSFVPSSVLAVVNTALPPCVKVPATDILAAVVVPVNTAFSLSAFPDNADASAFNAKASFSAVVVV